MTPETVAKIIEIERPDALLPTMGGQTGLNTSLALEEMGILKKYGVEMIGAKRAAIEMAEDRKLFREAMDRLGLENPRAAIAETMVEAGEALIILDCPPLSDHLSPWAAPAAASRTTAPNLQPLSKAACAHPPWTKFWLKNRCWGGKSLKWRSCATRADNCIIICSIENIDPMGIHTGDSITVAPALTLTDKEYQLMRDASIACLREIGVDTGGSNVQFAVNPDDGRLLMIEMNPRVSRSSALASKATGFPIAKVAAKLAVGYTLDEIDNDITKVTPASFEPTIDYVVTKMPRFTFEKFPGANAHLTTSMKSVGEAMSIGRTFPESLQKALRSMETDLTGLNEIDIEDAGDGDRDAIRAALSKPTPNRILTVAQAFRFGLSIDEINSACKIDPWFLEQISAIVAAESEVRENGLPEDTDALLRLKKLGFADARLAELTGRTEKDVAAYRTALDVTPVYKRIDTCAAEFPSQTPYMYSTYEGDAETPGECEADVSGPTQSRYPGWRAKPDWSRDRIRLLLRPCGVCSGRSGF